MVPPKPLAAPLARVVAVMASLILVTSACGAGDRPELGAVALEVATDAGTPSPPALDTSADAGPPDDLLDDTALDDTALDDAGPAAPGAASTPSVAAPNGRTYPRVPEDPEALAAEVIAIEQALRDPATKPARLPDLGHRQQVTYAKLATTTEWDEAVFALLPAHLVDDVTSHIDARRALIGLHSGYDPAQFVPEWEVIDPAPAADLLAFYREAEAVTGIEWEYLAAINLIETGMGRIVGLSSAGARGPMQFIQTTWEEAGIGEGNIDDPHDAIAAAARYLVRRGGPSDMNQALFGYNNDERYVEAVTHYAELLRRDAANFTGLYHWEIHFAGKTGALWFPVGYRREEFQPIEDYEAEAPWSVPPERRAD